MTFEGFERVAEQWHANLMMERHFQDFGDVSWDTKFTEFKSGEFKAVALTSSEELFEEGKEMHHCVSSYARYCEKGESRIFSIFEDDKKVATMEIHRSRMIEGHPRDPVYVWMVRQCYGPCNSEVKGAIKMFAHDVCAQYNQEQE